MYSTAWVLVCRLVDSTCLRLQTLTNHILLLTFCLFAATSNPFWDVFQPRLIRAAHETWSIPVNNNYRTISNTWRCSSTSWVLNFLISTSVFLGVSSQAPKCLLMTLGYKSAHCFPLQCVQKLVQPPESPDIKEHKAQDLVQVPRQPTPAPDSSPGARRAKRMKCEVGASDTWQLRLHCSPRFHIHTTLLVLQRFTSSSCFFSLCRLSVWRPNQVRWVRAGPTWGGGWALLLPNQNQVRLLISEWRNSHSYRSYSMYGNIH